MYVPRLDDPQRQSRGGAGGRDARPLSVSSEGLVGKAACNSAVGPGAAPKTNSTVAMHPDDAPTGSESEHSCGNAFPIFYFFLPCLGPVFAAREVLSLDNGTHPNPSSPSNPTPIPPNQPCPLPALSWPLPLSAIPPSIPILSSPGLILPGVPSYPRPAYPSPS